MKKAVSISLGSHTRDATIVVTLNDEQIQVERIGTDGDVGKARRLLEELDGEVDALSVDGVDLYVRLDEREYPFNAALRLIENVRHTPTLDGRGLKRTLDRRIFGLTAPALGGLPRFRRAFIPVIVDCLDLSEAVAEVSEEIIIGDLMVALGIPIPLHGLEQYRKVARVVLPLVSHLPIGMLYRGSRTERAPKCRRFCEKADVIAGDFLSIVDCLSTTLKGKTIITNGTTAEDINLLQERGARRVITTTPQYDGWSFSTNLMEAVLTAYAGKRRRLDDGELNALINELDLRPTVQWLNK